MDAKYLKVLDKIRKLLALAQSPNENEAAVALAMAQELMFRYNIDNIDLEKDSTEDIIEIDFKISHQAEESSLRFVYWLGKAFFVKPILIKRNIGQDKIKFERFIRFIGKQADVAAATFIFSYMISILDNKGKEYTKKIKIRKDYDFGFVTAVCKKLEKIEEDKRNSTIYTVNEAKNESALILSSRSLIESFIKDKYGDKLNDGKQQDVEFDLDAFRDGYVEGEKHGIFVGVESKEHNKEIENERRT